jgi:hypothetical protein
MEIQEIQDRFDRGYTMAIYGNRERIYEQMTEDIKTLLKAINYKPCCESDSEQLCDKNKRPYEFDSNTYIGRKIGKSDM